MRAAFLDTSVVLAMAFDDAGGGFITRAVRRFDRLYAGPLLAAEFGAVCAQHGVADQADRFLRPIRFVTPERSLVGELSSLAARTGLAGGPLFHLACACHLVGNPSGMTFISLDEQLSSAAEKIGFTIDFQ